MKVNNSFKDLVNQNIKLKEKNKYFRELNKKLFFELYELSNQKIKNDFIQKNYYQNITRNIIFLEFKKKLEQKLIKNKIPHLFYKGIYLIEKFPKLISSKILSDIDILIDEKYLNKFIKVLKDFKIEYIDNKFFENKYSFYETSIVVNYNNFIIDIDLHTSFTHKSKYNIDYSNLLLEKQDEIQFLALVIQYANSLFTEEDKLYYIVYMTKNISMDFDYIFNKINCYEMKKISYLIFKILNKEFYLNIDLEKIKLSRKNKVILNNYFKTNIFRIDQNLLNFFYFDSFFRYFLFVKEKILKINYNGISEIIKSIKRNKI